ncbi:MAG: hypothetical protein QOJ39_1181 [Candidatus Eremiobacteraeota bacterium]|jgi:hypothetical protein|nr:hypothetical protein [Candidatus Eremiobacteraeota bacterium]
MSITSLAISNSDLSRRLAADAPKKLSDFLDAITKFIPGDILTIFLAAEAAIRGAGVHVDTTKNTIKIDSWASQDIIVTMILCGLLIPFWITALRFIDGRTPLLAVWPIIAGLVAYVVYIFGAETIVLNPPKADPSTAIATTLTVIFIAPLLALVNQIIYKRWPTQAV